MKDIVRTHYTPQWKPDAHNPVITGYCVWAYIGHPLLGQIPGSKTVVATRYQAQKVSRQLRGWYN